MDGSIKCGWLDALSRGEWMDAISSGGWMDALSRVFGWMRLVGVVEWIL